MSLLSIAEGSVRLHLNIRANALTSATTTAFLALSETQNAAFDSEYHQPGELAAKLDVLENMFGAKPFTVLDLGCGNGHFADQVLARFPNASCVVLDVSALLLDRNTPSPRKTLVHGSAAELDTLFAERRFDCITINWVLHHLVADSYRGCRENCVATLTRCARLLAPGGVIVIAEHLFEGFAGHDVPSRLIYGLTSLRSRTAAKFVGKFFNTAGIGVCFHSRRAWTEIFSAAGLAITLAQKGFVWRFTTLSRRVGFIALGLKSVTHGHFFLQAR